MVYFFGVCVSGVDLGVSVKVCVPVRVGAAGRLKGLVHGLFVQRIGARGVHLAGHGQFNDFANALEGGVSTLNADLADGKAGGVPDQVQVKHVDHTGCELCVGYLLAAVYAHVRPTDKACGLLDHFLRLPRRWDGTGRTAPRGPVPLQ